ncbi:MAG: GNAT family N-acetyltransferase [Acidimicrobiales bacterium]
MSPDLPPPTSGYPLSQHEADTGTLLVAERDGELCGFGGTVNHDDRWVLGDLFVSPSVHGEGVGRRLLDALAAADRPAGPRATMGSSDHRALALYARLGMAPRWPCLYLMAPAGRLVLPTPAGATTEAVGSEHLVEAARPMGYVLHAADVEYWLTHAQAECVLVGSHESVLGGGVIRWITPFSITDPTTISLGPVFATSPDALLTTVSSIIATIRHTAGSRLLTCFVPGPNAVLAPLLDAGFRISDLDLFCASSDTLLDPQTALPSHDLL